jgi:hypothetical protein
MAALPKIAANVRHLVRVSRANRTIVQPDDEWNMGLDLLGPFAALEDIEAHLASAPPGSVDAAYALGYVTHQRLANEANAAKSTAPCDRS